jgi:hypothetical protein
MKQSVVLTVASMMSILLLTFHLTDGIVRGFEKGRADQSDGGADLRGLGLRRTHDGGTASGLRDHPARLVARAGGAGHSHDGEGCGCGGQHRPYERSFLFRLDADRHRRDFVIVRGSFGSRAVGAEAEIVLPKPAAVLVPPFRSCKPAASDGGTRCRVLLSAMHFRM